MKTPVSHSKDPDLQKAPQALMRVKGVVFEYFFQTVLLGYPFNLNYSINLLMGWDSCGEGCSFPSP